MKKIKNNNKIYSTLKLLQGITVVLFIFFSSVTTHAFDNDCDSILEKLQVNVYTNYNEFRQRNLPVNYLGVRVSDINKYEICSVLGATEKKEYSHYYDHSVNLKIGSQNSLYYKPSVLNTLSVSYVHGSTNGNIYKCFFDINRSTEELYSRMTKNPKKLYTTDDGNTIDLQFAHFYMNTSPVYYYADYEPQDTINMDSWERTLNDICSLFRSSKYQIFVTADFSCTYERRYFVNSIGSEEVSNHKSFLLTLNATITTDDGSVCPLEKRFLCNSLEEIPSKEQLLYEANDMLSKLSQLYYSTSLDNYVGPVLFGQEASGVLFHELIGHRLEAKNSIEEVYEITKQLNKQKLPNFLQISDDPQKTHFKGKTLAGHFLFDDEGIPSQKVDCIKDGVVISLLTSGKSYYEESVSNGHGRGIDEPEARQGNLFISSSYPVPDKKLREMLIEEIRSQKLDFGFYIPNINSGSATVKKELFDLADFASSDDFMITVDYVYKVYADGTPDEIIRGGTLVSSSKNLLCAIATMGDNPMVNNGYCQTRSGSVPVSLIAPMTFVNRMQWAMVKDTIINNKLINPLPEIPNIKCLNNKRETILKALTDELSVLQKIKAKEASNPYYIDINIHNDSFYYCDAFKEHLSSCNQPNAIRGNIVVFIKDSLNQLKSHSVHFTLPYMPDYYAIRHIVRKSGIVAYKACINKNADRDAELRHFLPFICVDTIQNYLVSPPKIQHTTKTLIREVLKHKELKNANVRLTRLCSDDYSVTSDNQTMMRSQVYLIITCQADLKMYKDRYNHIQFSIQLLEPELSSVKKIFRNKLKEAIDNYKKDLKGVFVDKTISYEGPVLFENESVKDYIFNRIGHRIYDKQIYGSKPSIGDTLFSANLNIKQLSGLIKYDNKRIWGYEKYDKNGIIPQAINLLVNGVLVNKLSGRIYYDSATFPTGNERFFGVSSGILLTTSPENVNSKHLMSIFLSKAKEKGAKYAYIIRKNELDGKEKIFLINTETKEEHLLVCDYQYKDLENSSYIFSKEKSLIQTRNLEPCSYICPRMMLCDNLLLFAIPKQTQQ